MKNYSDMSDFEINKAVAIQLGMKPFSKATGWQGLTSEPYIDVIVRGAGRLGAFNPCNNPSDALPIIVGSKINIRFCAEGIACEAQFIQRGHESVECYHANPLRAAMIVYLMMKDNENA